MPLLDKAVTAQAGDRPLTSSSQIEHSRHRSPVNFVVNVLCGLIAYCHRPRKPSLNLAALAS